MKHNQALWRSAYPVFARHLLIKIPIKAPGDILCLKLLVLLFPSGDEKSLSAAGGLATVLCTQAWKNATILEMAGLKAKFCVCLEMCQKIKPCRNWFFDNYKMLMEQQCRNHYSSYNTNLAILFTFVLNIT